MSGCTVAAIFDCAHAMHAPSPFLDDGATIVNDALCGLHAYALCDRARVCAPVASFCAVVLNIVYLMRRVAAQAQQQSSAGDACMFKVQVDVASDCVLLTLISSRAEDVSACKRVMGARRMLYVHASVSGWTSMTMALREDDDHVLDDAVRLLRVCLAMSDHRCARAPDMDTHVWVPFPDGVIDAPLYVSTHVLLAPTRAHPVISVIVALDGEPQETVMVFALQLCAIKTQEPITTALSALKMVVQTRTAPDRDLAVFHACNAVVLYALQRFNVRGADAREVPLTLEVDDDDLLVGLTAFHDDAAAATDTPCALDFVNDTLDAAANVEHEQQASTVIAPEQQLGPEQQASTAVELEHAEQQDSTVVELEQRLMEQQASTVVEHEHAEQQESAVVELEQRLMEQQASTVVEHEQFESYAEQQASTVVEHEQFESYAEQQASTVVEHEQFESYAEQQASTRIPAPEQQELTVIAPEQYFVAIVEPEQQESAVVEHEQFESYAEQQESAVIAQEQQESTVIVEPEQQELTVIVELEQQESAVVEHEQFESHAEQQELTVIAPEQQALTVFAREQSVVSMMDASSFALAEDDAKYACMVESLLDRREAADTLLNFSNHHVASAASTLCALRTQDAASPHAECARPSTSSMSSYDIDVVKVKALASLRIERMTALDFCPEIDPLLHDDRCQAPLPEQCRVVLVRVQRALVKEMQAALDAHAPRVIFDAPRGIGARTALCSLSLDENRARLLSDAHDRRADDSVVTVGRSLSWKDMDSRQLLQNMHVDDCDASSVTMVSHLRTIGAMVHGIQAAKMRFSARMRMQAELNAKGARIILPMLLPHAVGSQQLQDIITVWNTRYCKIPLMLKNMEHLRRPSELDQQPIVAASTELPTTAASTELLPLIAASTELPTTAASTERLPLIAASTELPTTAASTERLPLIAASIVPRERDVIDVTQEDDVHVSALDRGLCCVRGGGGVTIYVRSSARSLYTSIGSFSLADGDYRVCVDRTGQSTRVDLVAAPRACVHAKRNKDGVLRLPAFASTVSMRATNTVHVNDAQEVLVWCDTRAAPSIRPFSYAASRPNVWFVSGANDEGDVRFDGARLCEDGRRYARVQVATGAASLSVTVC